MLAVQHQANILGSVSSLYVAESYYENYCLCVCAAGVDGGVPLSRRWRVPHAMAIALFKVL